MFLTLQCAFSSLPVLLYCGLLAQLPASPCLGCHDCCGCLLRLLEPLQKALWGKSNAAPQPRLEMLPKILAMAEMVSQEKAGPDPSQCPGPLSRGCPARATNSWWHWAHALVPCRHLIMMSHGPAWGLLRSHGRNGLPLYFSSVMAIHTPHLCPSPRFLQMHGPHSAISHTISSCPL